jgi:hypothetical protein
MYVHISLFCVGRGQQRADSLTSSSYEISTEISVSEVIYVKSYYRERV